MKNQLESVDNSLFQLPENIYALGQTELGRMIKQWKADFFYWVVDVFIAIHFLF